MITINGKSYKGNSITIINDKVIIDGKEVETDEKTINITVEGSITKLKVDSCNTLEVGGDVHKLTTMSGDVEVSGNVTGSIETMSGDVDCGDVGGGIETMSGDVVYKKM